MGGTGSVGRTDNGGDFGTTGGAGSVCGAGTGEGAVRSVRDGNHFLAVSSLENLPLLIKGGGLRGQHSKTTFSNFQQRDKGFAAIPGFR